MSKSRRLRRLAPDDELYERRVAGEPLRTLALDYDVHHSTLVRFFRRPEAILELREARRRIRVESKAQKESVRVIKKRARDDQKRDRWLQSWSPPQRLYLSEEMVRLDFNEAPRGLTSQERYSESDHKAAEVVALGGGVEEVIEATGLRTLENVFRNIDPQIMRGAVANDDDRPDVRRLRRLAPDHELMRRRAAGETLRSIAADYDVSHTSLSRYYNRSEVAKQLRAQQRRRRPTA
jgi:hypothetical protein